MTIDLEAIAARNAERRARYYSLSQFKAEGRAEQGGAKNTCTAPGCDAPCASRYCRKHWRLAKREREVTP